MAWTLQHDRALLDEMSVSEVFQYRKGTPERDQVWDSIAVNLKAMEYSKFKVLRTAEEEGEKRLQNKF